MSIIKSGFLGGSYGTTGSIPIKFSISLFNAFLYRPLTSLFITLDNEVLIYISK